MSTNTFIPRNSYARASHCASHCASSCSPEKNPPPTLLHRDVLVPMLVPRIVPSSEITTINSILNRESIANEIKRNLLSFEENCKNINYKKGFYVYGSPGCGKTHFVIELLKELNYDIVKYDAGDVRNKSLIDTITSNNMSNQNVLQMMSRTRKKIAIVMDEIDGMNNGDKGGITSLIKLIRQKKTKKQKAENMTLNPIICIGNYFVDKKIKELMKVCNIYELKTSTTEQISTILENHTPLLCSTLKPDILKYIQGDMRKLFFVEELYRLKPEALTKETIHHILQTKSFNEDSKKITQTLLSEYIPIDKHNVSMNETDRTIVALLWHENIVDYLDKVDTHISFPFYLKILENMCFADYIDRITFQNQIWQFNEMSSLIKTFHNNKMFHDQFHDTIKPTQEIRFTKVLTKYSTEYNNSLFIFSLTQLLDMDKNDLVAFFQELRLFYGANFYNESDKINEAEKLFETYGMNKLDIKRMYRYLDKNVKKETVEEDEPEIEESI
jgi:DNA polymerase III delta prime subunit